MLKKWKMFARQALTIVLMASVVYLSGCAFTAKESKALPAAPNYTPETIDRAQTDLACVPDNSPAVAILHDCFEVFEQLRSVN